MLVKPSALSQFLQSVEQVSGHVANWIEHRPLGEALETSEILEWSSAVTKHLYEVYRLTRISVIVTH